MERAQVNEPGYCIAVLGATGLVGREMLRLLEQQRLPVRELRLFGSQRSAGQTLTFRQREVTVEPAREQRFAGVDILLSSAGGEVSRRLLPQAVSAGAICIDNTSAFRMDPDVPLVVPEVNEHQLDSIRVGQGGAIVANPNCSTIQLVVALKPLHDAAVVRRVVVSTYQSVAGAGRDAVQAFEGATRALLDGVQDSDLEPQLRGTVAFDVQPAIGELKPEGHTSEELKMVLETPKILEADVALDVCCVRVPVHIGHAESVLVETAQPLSPSAALRVLSQAEGVLVDDESAAPTPRRAAGQHLVQVGRVRSSRTFANGLQMWVVADNLLKGAALNAVQIAERIIAGSSGTPAHAAHLERGQHTSAATL